jgi:heterodisulfide reductase subunit A
MLGEAGISPLPMHWVDIREGCAFIHANDPKGATAKAADILGMGLAAVRRCESPFLPPATPPHRRILILGSGPAGLAAAKAASARGIAVTLVEKRPALGGMLPLLHRLFPNLSPASDVLARLAPPSGIDVRTGTAVADIRPAQDGFVATLTKARPGAGESEDVHAGAVILALGGQPVLPGGQLRHGKLTGVSSQMELETLLSKAEKHSEAIASLPRRAVFIQCVSARNDERPYCRAVCCPSALKNAIRLLECVPDAEVTVLHRNICMPGSTLEAFYRLARERGVRMRPMDASVAIEALGEEAVSGVRFKDASGGETVTLPCQALVCSTPISPAADARKLASMLNVRLDDMGFVCGEEPVHPLETPVRGVYCCGSVRWPCTVTQAIEEGAAAGLLAAAHVAGIPRTLGWMPANVGRATASVRAQDCSGCGRCLAACPHGACTYSPGSYPRRTVSILAGMCEGCGGCTAVCPTGAAHIPALPLAGMVDGIRQALTVMP